MKKLTYKVEFFSNWHCGSGQAAGADVDELAIKDRHGLPFIPGRTIKGLLSDAFDDLGVDSKEVFGYSSKDAETTTKGKAFFSDATLPVGEQKAIVDEGLKDYLYQSVSATAIDDNGIAKDHSLRKIQTVVPCTLEGTIMDVPDDYVGNMERAVKLVKRLGLGRNSGLGRCEITITKEE